MAEGVLGEELFFVVRHTNSTTQNNTDLIVEYVLFEHLDRRRS